MSEDQKILFKIGIVVLLLGLAVFGGSYQLNKSKCLAEAKELNITIHYSFADDCQVEVEGRLIPFEIWQAEHSGK